MSKKRLFLCFMVLLISCPLETNASISYRTIPAKPSRYPMTMGVSVSNNGDVAMASGKYPGGLVLLSKHRPGAHQARRSLTDWFAAPDISADGLRMAVMDVQALKPNSDSVRERLVVLDRHLNILRSRLASGSPVFSLDGKRVMVSDDFGTQGVSVYAVSSGELLWHVPVDPHNLLRQAKWSPDGACVLLTFNKSVEMVSKLGRMLWGVTFTHGIVSADTSNRGQRTAILVGGQDRNLVIVNRRGDVVSNTHVFTETRYSSAYQSDEVGITSDGALVVICSNAGASSIEARTISGISLWDRKLSHMAFPRSLHMLPSGIAFRSMERSFGFPWTNAGNHRRMVAPGRMDLISRNGRLVAVDTLPAGSHILAFSRDGAFFSTADSNGHIATFAVPASLRRRVKIFTYYDGRQLAGIDLDNLRKREAKAKQGGHMPWRTDPLWVSATIGSQWLGTLLPRNVASGHFSRSRNSLGVNTGQFDVMFRSVRIDAKSAKVAVWSDGSRVATLGLRRPLGYWWYVTSRSVVRRGK